MSETLKMDFEYNTTPAKLWSALTDSGKLAKWTMSNNFQPVVGHEFEFRTEPSEYWDGIVTGKVLAVEEPHRLSYTWESGDEKHVVNWTLKELEGGKVSLHLEQTGISNKQAAAGAKYGWQGWLAEMEKLLEE